MQIASLIAVEIQFEIKLIIAQSLVASKDAEEERRTCGSGVKMLRLRRIRGHGYQHGRKTRRRDSAAPVEISAHAHTAAYTHGQLRIFAHEQEIGCAGILKMPELVVIEYRNLTTYRVDLTLHLVGCGTSVDEYNLVGGSQSVVEPVCQGVGTHCRQPRDSREHNEEQLS